VAPGVFAAELAYLRDHEWAQTADDVLWRRSKLGLHLDAAQQHAIAAWLQAPLESRAVAAR
jgi:glycerol-3-phosphate dehydrogenase